jgi:TIGR02594 family protein
MAVFNPTPEFPNAQSWLGYSKEPEKIPVDKSMETLFSGIGDTVSAAANGIDTAIKHNIKEDLYSEFDKLRDAHGAGIDPDDAASIAGTGARGAKWSAVTEGGGTPEDIAASPAKLPSGVTSGGETLAKYKAALDAGEMSETHFDLSAEKIVRSMRTKYPGYRDEIDSMTSSILGITPANAARKSVLADLLSMENAQNTAKNKIEQQFLKDREWIMRLYPEADVSWYAANKSVVDTKVGQYMAEDQLLKSDALKLANSKSTREEKSVESERLFTNQAGFEVKSFLDSVQNTLIKKKDQLIAQGASASGAEIQQLQLQAGQVIDQVKARLLNVANERRTDSNGKLVDSHAMHIGIEKTNKIIDQQIEPLKTIASSLSNNNNDGIAKATSNLITANTDRAVLEIQKKVPQALVLGALRKSLGDAAVGTIVATSDVLAPAMKAVHDAGVAGVIGDGNGAAPPTATDVLKSMGIGRPRGNASGQATRMVFSNWQKLATHENPETAARAVESLYTDPGMLPSFSSKEREQVFTMLASPAFSQKMIELGKTKPQAFQQYSQWVEQSFQTVAKPAIDTLQNDLVKFNRFDTEFHPDTMQFSAKPRPGYEKNTGSPIINEDPEKYAFQTLAPINRFLKQVQPVLEEKYGKADAPRKLLDLMQTGGLDLAAAKQGTVLEQLGKAIYNMLPSPTPNPTYPIPDRIRQRSGNVEQRSEAAPSGKLSLIDTTIMDAASKFIGLHEQTDGPVLASFIKKATGKTVDPSVQPWCADFVNAVLGDTGEAGTGSSYARSFLAYGKATDKPTAGDVVVLSRGSKDGPYGHVGFVKGIVEHDGQRYVQVLGGNQGNRVSVQEFPVSRVLGYRRVGKNDLQAFNEASNSEDTA